MATSDGAFPPLVEKRLPMRIVSSQVNVLELVILIIGEDFFPSQHPTSSGNCTLLVFSSFGPAVLASWVSNGRTSVDDQNVQILGV